MRPEKKRGVDGARTRAHSPSDVLAKAAGLWPTSRSPTQVIADILGAEPVPHEAPQDDGVRVPPQPARHPPPNGVFWQIWAQHQDYLRRHSLRWMSNNCADAEDALSSAMLLAQEKYPRYAPTINDIRAWLTRLVHNVCMDHHRSRVRLELFDPMAQNGEVGGHDSHAELHVAAAEQEVADQETLSLIWEELQRLTATLREPLLLRCVDELSYAEIAARLKITEAAVRKRVQLARDKLRERFGGL
jgi:RNA polymerase sigma factor (sigma-70 family)